MKMKFNRRSFLATVAATAGSLSVPRLFGAVEPFLSQAVATFRNPIIRGDYPDPSIVRVGGRYYITHSDLAVVQSCRLGATRLRAHGV